MRKNNNVSLIKFLGGLNGDENPWFSRAHGTYKEIRDVGCEHHHWSPEAEYVARHLCDGTHPLSILRLKQLLNSWEMTFDS